MSASPLQGSLFTSSSKTSSTSPLDISQSTSSTTSSHTSKLTSPASGNAPKLTVSQFLAICNQTLDYAFPSAIIEGEVMSYKVNQGKWVFFDLKDNEASINCFLPVYQLRFPLEDGMKIIVRGHPGITKWGKFSLTVQQILPVGAGTIKKSFDLLKEKLTKEGLFNATRKRPLPDNLQYIGVISSTQAAGYADFIKILNERWGGLEVTVAHTSVQGLSAADQIIRAIRYFNETDIPNKSQMAAHPHSTSVSHQPQVIAILRGGGSADDLAVFNDEKLVRAIASSKIPVITGIGHEVDETLSDLAADLRGSTPSNVAQMLTPDRQVERTHLHTTINRLESHLSTRIATALSEIQNLAASAERQIMLKITSTLDQLHTTTKVLTKLNPELVLSQGYAILRGALQPGNVVEITTLKYQISAKIQQIHPRK